MSLSRDLSVFSLVPDRPIQYQGEISPRASLYLGLFLRILIQYSVFKLCDLAELKKPYLRGKLSLTSVWQQTVDS